MKIRHKLIIILAGLLVALNGTIGFLIYKRTRQEFNQEMRGKAKLLAMELETSRNYLAKALQTTQIEINEQTKHYIPAIYGHSVAKEFAEKTGYIIKQTSLNYRNEYNKPDDFEEEILLKMEEDPDLKEYWSSDVIDGRRVERYLYALYIREDCLLCHGEREKAPEFVRNNYDIAYDYKVGDLRGAISVIIPKEIAEQRFASDIIFFIIMGSTSIFLIIVIIFLTTGKFLKPIENLTDAVTNIIRTNDLSTRVNITSNDEVGRLGKAFNEMSNKLRSSYATLEQRIAEKTENLEKAIAALKRANKMKSEFLANMSHELRTPLNAIIGFAEVLKDKTCGELNTEQEDFVKDIHSSGQHLLQMINDILDLSKIEAGKMSLQYESFIVTDAIDEVYHILKGLASKKKLHLETTIQPDVQYVEADRVKFKQILYNLLSNAIKFTPQGGTIKTSAGITDDCLQVSVSDTGIGMKPEDKRKIFKEFWQADSSFSRKYEGTGLGLALTKRIVEMHGGRIWFKSEKGEGSTFYFKLPRAATSPSLQTEIKKEEEKQPPLESSSEKSGKNAQSILVVEDNRMAAELLSVYLKGTGYQVIVAENGEEAVKMAKKHKPFLITLDIMLPGIDGWDVLSQLKSNQETEKIPVIIVSIVDNKYLGYSLGAAEYLIKPIGREKLMDAVNSVISNATQKEIPMKILVVDDDKNAIKYVSTILKKYGFEVFTANGGKAGIDLATSIFPDLIILDLMMPEISGFDVVENLRKHPKAKGIPIIICSAKDITPEEKEKLNGNILDIVQKGSHTKEDLLKSIKKIEQLYQGK